MKVKTAGLIGPALDWAVAQCEMMRADYRDRGLLVHRIGYGQPIPPYTIDWSQGGPILEREGIELFKGNPLLFVDGTREDLWIAKHQRVADIHPNGVHGPTLLIAAMRCFCCAKLGDEVDIPEELLK